ncbi:MAG: S8 family peptidase [Chitinophaga sp.]|uniref:S8 family peptidase n=1 Tax=Chitinophaga sp. TaxID=1869181 RepID=UPI0025BFB1D2|nr:S8 family peptidase [Chitinophaga sp.]MBV8252531.1 S8 family peptidase [Chitinophaga sp.]
MNYYLPKFPFLLVFLAFSCIMTAAQDAGKTDSMRLRYSTLRPADTLAQQPGTYYLVKFNKSVPVLKLSPYGLLKVLSSNCFILSAIPRDLHLKKNMDYADIANCNWKASDNLVTSITLLPATDSIAVQVSFKDSLPNTPATHIISYRKDYHTAVIRLAVADWQAFICQEQIHFADQVRKAHIEMIVNTANPYVNRINVAQQFFPNFNGKSIAVSVKEDRFDTTDIDLAGRIIYNPDASPNVTSHASTMATIIAGAGNTGALGLGAAPGAGISSSDFNKSLLPDTSTYYRNYNITIQNHSYGTTIENYYGNEAAAYDQQIATADTIVHVFSAGNIGTQTPTSGTYQNLVYANLSGNFKQAKNVIVTGGTDADGRFLSLASHGPAYDGRIKPEISAFGQDGTSGAAAAVSGVVTMVQDAWRQLHFTAMPSALLKAILINSAKRPTGAMPDYKSGFGNLHAAHALQTLQDKRYIIGGATNNNTTTSDITIPANTQTVKITLCWNDPAAAANAPKALINDLDLRVTGTDGQTYLPWVLNPYPQADSLAASAKRGIDTLNNVEQVTIDNPAAGIAHIAVQAKQLRGNQSWYIAYEFIPKQTFVWQQPDTNTLLSANTDVNFYWETTYTGNGAISYSLDSGRTWSTIISGLPISAEHLGWFTPAVFSKAMLKFQLPDTAFISPVFGISPVVNIKVGFNCADSVLLFWSPVTNASAYQLYTMGKTALQPFKQLRDTFLIIPKSQLNSTYFAVSPIHQSGWEGQRGYTLDFTKQGVSCYVRALIADRTSDNSVQLTLTLATEYKLKTIAWQRYNGKTWETLQTVPSSGSLLYYYTDTHTWEGIMYYRVMLTTTDGRTIYSDISTVQLPISGNILLFPNPVVTTLGIMDAQVRERQVVITDMSGKVRIRATITNTLEGISVAALPAGMYTCVIYWNGARIFTRKFVKQ